MANPVSVDFFTIPCTDHTWDGYTFPQPSDGVSATDSRRLASEHLHSGSTPGRDRTYDWLSQCHYVPDLLEIRSEISFSPFGLPSSEPWEPPILRLTRFLSRFGSTTLSWKRDNPARS
jgi:hypothetical protein